MESAITAIVTGRRDPKKIYVRKTGKWKLTKRHLYNKGKSANELGRELNLCITPGFNLTMYNSCI